jgi:hypothetical protein
MMVAQDGDSLAVEASLTDARLAAHTARAAVQSYVAVLLRTSAGAPLGTLCQFDMVPRPADRRDVDCLFAVRASIERALWAGPAAHADAGRPAAG